MLIRNCRKYIPITSLMVGLILFLGLGGSDYISMEAIGKYYKELDIFVDQHYYMSTLLYIIIYIVAVALSFPGAAVLTLVGGFLFGVWLGTVWVMFSSIVGAVITYFAVNSAFGDFFKTRVEGRLKSIQQGFSENEFYYLLTLRLIPIVPFFIINIASGIVGVRMRNFIIASLIGMAPCAVIYTWVGSSFGKVLAHQQDGFTAKILLQPEVIIPLILLGILSLMPIFMKKFKKTRKAL